MTTTSATNVFSILQSAYTPAAQTSIPPGSKFAKVDPTQWQATWTTKDSNGSRSPFRM
jgi:hypothetical protein